MTLGWSVIGCYTHQQLGKLLSGSNFGLLQMSCRARAPMKGANIVQVLFRKNIQRSFSFTSSPTRSCHRKWNYVTSGFEKPVGLWLLSSAGMIYGMILLGGYTRLTLAGLSMTEWSFSGRPLPSSNVVWEEEFQKYKMTPEYQAVHYRLTLPEFKRIYLTEWFHRMCGRATGLVFGVGATYFLSRGVFKKPMILATSGFLSVGSLQGLIGWWMVKSGLEDRERARVSPYRLVFHFTTAVALYSSIIWTALTVLQSGGLLEKFAYKWPPLIKIGAVTLATITGMTLVSGGFVAGLDAGHCYNTWPKMHGRWIPLEVYDVVKSWRSLFENSGVVQFAHRCFAYSTVFINTAFFLYVRAHPNLPRQLKIAAHFLPAIAATQVLLGITTLLMQVPLHLGVAHQAGGVATWTVSLVFLHMLFRRSSPLTAITTPLKV